jgi:hypothetical protein
MGRALVYWKQAGRDNVVGFKFKVDEILLKVIISGYQYRTVVYCSILTVSYRGEFYIYN